MIRPVGYFVHHQGRGHAERAASIANAEAFIHNKCIKWEPAWVGAWYI